MLRRRICKRLASYATGFMTPAEVIDMLLDKVEGVKPVMAAAEKGVKRSANGKNLTKYKFNGAIHSKRKLAFEIVKQYCKDNPEVTMAQLEKVFPPEIQSYSLPVFMEWREALEKYLLKSPTRFFTGGNQKIKVADGAISVCNQWSSDNIDNLIEPAQKMGYQIEVA